MKKTIKGKYGITATVLAYSISAAGVRMLTYELEYPRLILAELNTHRALSKNSFSSRAVPFEKMLHQLYGRPVRFGANQAGMQDKGEDFDALVKIQCPDGDDWEFTALEVWDMAKKDAIYYAQKLKDAGYHKQVYNRLLEPFQMMKTVLSGTEFANFFWLRDDDLADPTLRELARVMKEAADESEPFLLQPGQWHLPYVDWMVSPATGQMFYRDTFGTHIPITLEDAIKLSCARCAAVSYRNEGYDLAKSIELFERLVGADKKHASALEHCATPMQEQKGTPMSILDRANLPFRPDTWQPGISHVDRKGNLWSGNLKGWVQYRKLIPGENYEGE